MEVNQFDYILSKHSIAQFPTEKRDESKLMVLNRNDNSITNTHFNEIISYINQGDCLVINNSKVLPARLLGKKKSTGAKIEVLLLKNIENDIWQALIKPGKRVKENDVITFSEDDSFTAEALKYGEDGTRIIKFHYSGVFLEQLEKLGGMPLPPYIERSLDHKDKYRYQTVYSEVLGSVAAPTAGLHFTDELLNSIEEKGASIAKLTLHVGIGTFRPVKSNLVKDHHMHFEQYNISKETADKINNTMKNGGKIICVGTTSVRTIESAAVFQEETGEYYISSGDGNTDIFIYPGYKFKIVDKLITNFHLPKSTLLMLVSAFYNKEHILEAYEAAKELNYRFFSYGDAMLIE